MSLFRMSRVKTSVFTFLLIALLLRNHGVLYSTALQSAVSVVFFFGFINSYTRVSKIKAFILQVP